METAAGWLARIVTTKTDRKEQEASLTADFEVNTGLSFFAKAKAAIKGLIKTGSSAVQEIQYEVDRRPNVLLDAIEAIVGEAQAALRTKEYQSLVVIVDGLEKIPLIQIADTLTAHTRLFIHGGNHLKTPSCHLIYTLPLGLLNQAHIGQIFPEQPIVMPMVHIRHRNGKEDWKALQLFTEIINRRVASSLFAPGVIKTLALASGGHIRDFLHLVHEAAGNFGERITRKDADLAKATLVGFYNRTIDRKFIDSLDYVAEHGILPGGPYDGLLVNLLLVLDYCNNESWSSLHPCVQAAPRYARSPRGNPEENQA